MGLNLFGSSSKSKTEHDSDVFGNTQDFGGSSNSSNVSPITLTTGVKSSKNNFNITTVSADYGAIENALSFAGQTLNTVENIATEALISNNDIVDQVLLGNTETNLAISGLASENGDNLTYLADATISGNQALTETAMNNNALLVSQFGSDMFAMSDRNAELSQAAMDNTAALSSQFSADLNTAYSGFGADLTAVTESAQAANAQLTSEVNNLVTDINTQGNQTLMQMAEMQSRGLDNALEIAGNMSMDDSAEASTDMIKYISIAAGIVAVAMVFK